MRSGNLTPFTRGKNSRNVGTTAHSTDSSIDFEVFTFSIKNCNNLIIWNCNNLISRTAIVEFIRHIIEYYAQITPFCVNKQTECLPFSEVVWLVCRNTACASAVNSTFGFHVANVETVAPRAEWRLYYRSSSAPRQRKSSPLTRGATLCLIEAVVFHRKPDLQSSVKCLLNKFHNYELQ